jgi:hypothetical protein
MTALVLWLGAQISLVSNRCLAYAVSPIDLVAIAQQRRPAAAGMLRVLGVEHLLTQCAIAHGYQIAKKGCLCTSKKVLGTTKQLWRRVFFWRKGGTHMSALPSTAGACQQAIQDNACLLACLLGHCDAARVNDVEP